ncbi:MAG: hemin uptake protein HemP [Pirellulales bacterium]
MNEPEKDASDAGHAHGETPAAIRVIPSEDLLRGERQVVILHHGEAYRLLVTRNDKLLLQK